MSGTPKPYARPGESGLYCGTCGDAMMRDHDISRERHGPIVWSCLRCNASWRVLPSPVITAMRETDAERVMR